jgi:hypothetical protein
MTTIRKEFRPGGMKLECIAEEADGAVDNPPDRLTSATPPS